MPIAKKSADLEETAAKKTVAKKSATKKAAVAKESAETEKKTAKKTAAKEETTLRKRAATKETAEKKETAPKKKTAAKKAEPKINVVIEYSGKQVKADDVIASVIEAYAKENPESQVETIELYIQPEKNVAYYVINGESVKNNKVKI